MLQQPELLAPAGSLETLKYAVMYGADAVYCALPEFGMRAAPVNLTVGELHEGCIFAHARGKKVYLTLNTLPTNEELSKLPRYIQDAAEAGETAEFFEKAILKESAGDIAVEETVERAETADEPALEEEIEEETAESAEAPRS